MGRDLASLPAIPVDHRFTERVVRSASAARTKAVIRKRSWMAAAAVGLATAAAVLLVIRPWRSEANVAPVVKVDKGQDSSPGGQPEKTRGAMELKEEAVVVRLRVPKDVPIAEALDAALKQAGLAQRPMADATTGAVEVATAYRQQLEQRHAGGDEAALEKATTPAWEAMLVEAPQKQIDAALAALAESAGPTIKVATEGRLAFDRPKSAEKGEGEASGMEGTSAAGKGFAQHLNATLFRLEKSAAGSDTPIASGANDTKGQGQGRVLILVERVEGE
jgi:hypothetical protein